jgi:hypothetical protein
MDEILACFGANNANRIWYYQIVLAVAALLGKRQYSPAIYLNDPIHLLCAIAQ